MDFLDIIRVSNQDCNLSHKIKGSCYVEDTLFQEDEVKCDEEVGVWYNTIDECIYYRCDTMVSLLKSNEKDFYIRQLILKICSEIDENKERYESFNYNNRVMNKGRIQQALQGKNKLLSICYLSDYYKKHIVLVDGENYYETSLLNYPKIYIECNKNHYRMIERVDKSLKKKDIIMSCLDLLIDNSSKIKSLNIYKTDMKAISNYTLNELMTIAINLKINIKKDGKTKKKKDIYNDILLTKINFVNSL